MAGFQMSFDEVHRSLLPADAPEVLPPPRKSDTDQDRAKKALRKLDQREPELGRALSPNEASLPGATLSYEYVAYQFETRVGYHLESGRKFETRPLVKTNVRRIWEGQKFAPSATPWELARSILAKQSSTIGFSMPTPPGACFAPIVAPGLFGAFDQVVGHLGAVNGTDLIAPTKLAAGSVQGVLARGMLFVAEEAYQIRPPGGWTQVGFPSHNYVVYTTPDGQVLGVLGTSDRGGAIDLFDVVIEHITDIAKWIDRHKWEIMLSILIPEVAPVVARLATRGAHSIRGLIGRLKAGQQVRGLLAGATPELSASVAAEQVAAKGVYNEIAGITRAHHQAFMDAAAESQLGIVVRHTNPKSIPLIEKWGCPGKPKNLEFINTGPKSGIVMANTTDEVLRAQRLGYYIVGDGNQATRLVIRNGVEVAEELRLQSPFWQLEKGQVLDPKLLKPIVGDYDLMGVFPMSSPGQNVGLVVSNGQLVTDFTNPLVQRAAAAVNRRLDMPRVLHGPQDMYKGFRKAASVYLPDGTVLHFETEEAVKAYYASIGRQTRTGAYPRPSPGTPVTDELAARRRP